MKNRIDKNKLYNFVASNRQFEQFKVQYGIRGTFLLGDTNKVSITRAKVWIPRCIFKLIKVKNHEIIGISVN